ncbi:MAG: TIGR00180 family glycosyltransferase [Candidatus Omnitrophica bacterium]|nr:TIGR00180 family glycosyltransferase [Candidatus Omnitrophota bacterium]
MKQESPNLITIVVPTFNRYPFLLRLLRYYGSFQFPFPMHVLDSSSDSLDDAELKELLRSPRVRHTAYDPECSPVTKIAEGVKHVTTPYVVFWSDDDLLVPRSVDVAARFLEDHGDFSIAQGQIARFTLDAVRGDWPSLNVSPFVQHSYTSRRACDRLLRFASGSCSLFYSVYRAQNLRSILEQCVEHGFGYYWSEMALAWLSVIDGKVKSLDTLYMFRHIHDARDTWREGSSWDCFDWVTSMKFPEKYAAFNACLSEALVRQDGISQGEAHQVVKQAFWSFLAGGLTRNGRWRYGWRATKWGGRLRRFVRARPELLSASRRLRTFFPAGSRGMSVSTLKRAGSKYHEDFLPIYRAVMETKVSP